MTRRERAQRTYDAKRAEGLCVDSGCNCDAAKGRRRCRECLLIRAARVRFERAITTLGWPKEAR